MRGLCVIPGVAHLLQGRSGLGPPLSHAGFRLGLVVRAGRSAWTGPGASAVVAGSGISRAAGRLERRSPSALPGARPPFFLLRLTSLAVFSSGSESLAQSAARDRRVA